MLTGHEGECKNLHGHTYKLHVTIKRIDTTVDENSMVVDFAYIYGVVKEVVMSKFDHATLLNLTSEIEKEIYNLLISNNMRTCVFNQPTTVENMSRAIYKLIENVLDSTGLKVVSIKLWETPTSFAEYEGGE